MTTYVFGNVYKLVFFVYFSSEEAIEGITQSHDIQNAISSQQALRIIHGGEMWTLLDTGIWLV